jgi:hypothetical protein
MKATVYSTAATRTVVSRTPRNIVPVLALSTIVEGTMRARWPSKT